MDDVRLAATLQRIDEKITDLGESAAVMKQQLPILISHWEKAADRLDNFEREVTLLKPLLELFKDHEMRIRAAEASTLKLAAQAAVIASLVGSALPLIFKLLGQ